MLHVEFQSLCVLVFFAAASKQSTRQSQNAKAYRCNRTCSQDHFSGLTHLQREKKQYLQSQNYPVITTVITVDIFTSFHLFTIYEVNLYLTWLPFLYWYRDPMRLCLLLMKCMQEDNLFRYWATTNVSLLTLHCFVSQELLDTSNAASLGSWLSSYGIIIYVAKLCE